MDQMRFVFSVLLLLTLTSIPFKAQSKHIELKTINVSLPTNFGTFFGEIHYSNEDRVEALKVERIITEDLIKVINYFEYVPHDTVHFNIDPFMRLTNGSATVFPTNIINLYNFPANNLDHLVAMENWMQGLVVHEFVHITHLDQTRDYLNIGRKIFGTIAKTPASIVPRWFTEGIAVWGESYLITGGRLHNPLFNKELFILFKKNDFCKTIDCLDEPGTYPNGQLAYWAGAHFIEYLENLKPKTIKCLVEENSLALPFFLNNAFEKCTGDTAQNQFIKFRDDYIAHEAPLSIEKQEWGEKISNAFGVDNYQKGLVLDGDRLFKVEREKKSEALVAYDLTDNITFLNKYEYPIEDVSAMVATDNETRMLLVSFNEDPNYRSENKVWKLIHPETLLVERTLKFAHDPSYVISLGGESYITFSYFENHWIVERNDDLLKSFSSDLNLNLVKKIGDQLLLKINDSYGTSFLVISDLKLQNLKVVYKSTNLYDLPLITDTYLIIREKSDLKLLEWDKAVQLSTLPADFLNRITFAEVNEGRVLVLENRLKTQSMTAKESEKFIKKFKSNSKIVSTSPFQSPAAPATSFAEQKSESYPRLDHLIPYYWFLATGNSENLGSIGAMTAFVDPMGVHTINATALLYPTVSKAGGSVDYVQKIIPINDQWKTRAFVSQEYSKTTFSDKINSARNLMLSTDYSFLKKRWTYNPGIFAGQSKTEDFISDRSVGYIGFSQDLSFKAMSFDDFFQDLQIGIDLQSSKANIGKSYTVAQLTGHLATRFSEKLTVTIKGSYGKLFKTDFSRGVIYGGGLTDLTGKHVHEFYGVPYSNAYGNEILTARMTIDYNFWNIYKGRNLLPFFFKEVHFLFGRESMYADRIILDNTVLREKLINAIFAGPRLKMNLFYFVPTNIDLIFSSIAHPNGKNVNKVDFTIVSDLF
jgi:hypothetical protein